MSEVLDRLASARVVPVLRSLNAAEALSSARGYARGGMPVIELTFSTPGVIDAIAELANDPDTVVGVGTVVNRQQAVAAVKAGARFLVSPVTLPWMVEFALDNDVVVIPGAATPTEVHQAFLLGAQVVKVFPIARLGGPAYIRDLLAPFPDARLMATGGVTATTARPLLDAGCIAVGVGAITLGDDAAESAERRARSFLRWIEHGTN